ncbi:phage tail assembly chaperone family protein, TAC [Pseudomonas azerbaijanoccidens]|uniref:phage tail assembly chaperone family protein, TAC n=1 Tax=Pseudomonas azerbaijanoccidentalis TaxID=2842347 RepID=UPI00200AD488|nr:phage tail assembly chaperone family protein, TAC [Pseudomonas azerbaijanoccidentalis]MCK8669301.1 phage tail assembly chaperone family protein, TAC [Pseudomonas azerbaijanoccidentalis]
MELSINALKAAGAFVALPVKKDISWHADGNVQKASIYVRQDSFHTLTKRWEEQREGADATAHRIATSVCNEAGEAVFTVEDILGSEESGHGPLTAELTIALLAAIQQANGVSKEDAEKK